MRAEPVGSCRSFAWPVETELAWLSAGNSETVESGARLASPPANALSLRLIPSASISLPVEPSGRPKDAPVETFAGTVLFDGLPAPHLYQVTLSSAGWIDVVQNGVTLKSVGHTGSKECPTLRKSVRFEIGPGPFILQLSGVAENSIRVTVRPAQ